MTRRQTGRKAEKRHKRKEAKTDHVRETVKAPVELTWRTQAQRHAYEKIGASDISFLLGSAGSGKTFLAMAYAINAVLSGQQSHIVLTRPIVDAGEKLGFLPGTFGEKVNPYMQPLYDVMDALLGRFSPKREVINKAVVIAPLCYMRGRTFNDSVCIFDEAQNATYMQFKLFLSRFGQNSKIIVTGDPLQSDLPVSQPPLNEVINKLKGTAGISMTQFTYADVVRHPLVAAILKKL